MAAPGGMSDMTTGAVVQSDMRVLAPKFGLAVADLLNAMWRRGLDPVVYETLRTAERQAWLYAQGRTRPGAIVTKASSHLTSWHGYGLAVDIISASKGWGAPDSFWTTLGREATARGLAWGGDWAMRDLPHVQLGPPMRTTPSSNARHLLAAGGLPAVWREVGAL